MKNVIVYGSTGSVGRQTLDVIEKNSEHFSVLAIIGNKNIPLLRQQWEKFHSKFVGISDEKLGHQAIRDNIFQGSQVVVGKDVKHLASLSETDIVVIASGGISSLDYVLESAKTGKHIAIANKETIVCCGEFIKQIAKKNGAVIIPVDSEHSAIWQCLKGEKSSDMSKLILTASGGSFLRYSMSDLDNITPEMAVKHPNWDMGAKITIDSSTMMNKALEMIEAMHLFDTQEDKIDVIIHPESIVHSMVQFVDGTTLAQLSYPSMEIPIAMALTKKYRGKTNVEPLDIAKISSLHFEEVDKSRHKAIFLAREVMKKGGYYPLCLNVANEILVEEFLKRNIIFTDIVNKNIDLLNKIDISADYNLENVEHIIESVKKETRGMIK